MLLEACTKGEMLSMAPTPGGGPGAVGVGVGPGTRHVALRMLLQFLGHLERQVLNGYEGCVSLPPASTTSQKFFRGNRRVCEDWFSRLRPSLLRAAGVAGSAHLVYEHASRRLPDIVRQLLGKAGEAEGRKLREEADSVGVLLCSALRDLDDADAIQADSVGVLLCPALRDLDDADAIQGYVAWSKSHAKLLLPPGFSGSTGGGSGGYWAWAQGLALQTRGHFQEAQDVYQEALAAAGGRSFSPES
ncbi:hypothetical protein T484DRAFT_1759962 [Baffinella frigidus]|nr:hypothetical protein T484DRAFT_1759962 [Cryptophyta sp. CCMP2293]